MTTAGIYHRLVFRQRQIFEAVVCFPRAYHFLSVPAFLRYSNFYIIFQHFYLFTCLFYIITISKSFHRFHLFCCQSLWRRVGSQGSAQSIEICIDKPPGRSPPSRGARCTVCWRAVQTKRLFTLITGGNNPRHMALMRKHKSLTPGEPFRVALHPGKRILKMISRNGRNS